MFIVNLMQLQDQSGVNKSKSNTHTVHSIIIDLLHSHVDAIVSII